MDHLRIATRKSRLAMWQAEHVRQRLQGVFPGLEVELIGLTTTGDRLSDTPLAAIGGKGLFIKELEQALRSRAADIAVHSMKDVPVELAADFQLPVILDREDPRDALIAPGRADLGDLAPGARIGTSSLRRQCQLRSLRPDFEIGIVRGNIDTRLRKLDAGEFDALILAAAGVKRLALTDRVASYLEPAIMLPAIGQGAIGIECRAGDEQVARLIAPLNHVDTGIRVRAERALNSRLGGSCEVPVAGYAELSGGTLVLAALVGSPDGVRLIRGRASGAPRDAEAIGTALADDLLSRGAGALLERHARIS